MKGKYILKIQIKKKSLESKLFFFFLGEAISPLYSYILTVIQVIISSSDAKVRGVRITGERGEACSDSASWLSPLGFRVQLVCDGPQECTFLAHSLEKLVLRVVDAG